MNKRTGIVVVILVVVIVGVWALRNFLGSRCAGSGFAFYEGNGATQDCLCVIKSDLEQSIILPSGGCSNDEARSVALINVKQGSVLRLYDSPEGKLEDDWAEITVKQDASRHVVSSFERAIEDDIVRVTYHRNNGLDGKISLVEISRTSGGPSISLYEGNRASQNKVCELFVTESISIKFSEHPECDNDEARSAILYDVSQGLVIRLYDSPEGSWEDDWVEILVKQSAPTLVIDSFEKDLDNEFLRVIYHKNNGLDGKVSRLEVKEGGFEPTVDLHEGNNGAQNLVCGLIADSDQVINFQNGGDCDNDEARSISLFNFPAGRVVRLYDSPSGSLQDDWTEIFALKDLPHLTIGTFERDINENNVRVTYHGFNGLDGKVSRIEFSDSPTGHTVEFYEAENAKQDRLCTLDTSSDRSSRMSDEGCPNDEARSIILYNPQVGKVIRLYDHPDGSMEDDWTEIEIRRSQPKIIIQSFESEIDNSDLRVSYFRNNGLNGKVSRVEFGDSQSILGFLSFYEGNNASQNKVCDLTTGDHGKINFKNHRQCDNDEARSLVLSNIRAGYSFTIYDDPGCGTGDDWTRITVRNDLARLVINSFEKNISENDSPDILVDYHRDNGLDGKVSCISLP